MGIIVKNRDLSKHAPLDPRRATGQRGEALAARYVQGKGYGIIATNWRGAGGELDLIATDGATLVFIEVRTRRAQVDGLAAESVTRAKQRKLAMLAELYLQELDARGTPWPGPYRIDVVAIQVRGARAQVRHIVSAVEAVED